MKAGGEEVLCWIFHSSRIHCENTNLPADTIRRRSVPEERTFMRELVLLVSVPFHGRPKIFGGVETTHVCPHAN